MMHGGGLRRLADLPDEKAHNRSIVFFRLIAYLRPYQWQLAGSIILVILNAASQGASPFLIGRAIDNLISQKDTTGLAWNMILLAFIFAVGMLTTRFQILVISKIGQNILADIRLKVFTKIESLSLQYLESRQAGEIISRLTNDIDTMNSFFSQTVPQMVGALFALLGIGIAMLLVSWQLGIAVLAMVPVLLFTTGLFSKIARNAFRKTRSTIGDVSAGLEEELGGVRVAQAFNRSQENVKRFSERNAANRDANINATAVTSAFAPTMEVLTTLDFALVAGMGGAMAIAGTISVGTVIAFVQYVQNFFRPIQTVAQMWTIAQSAFAAAERIFELLDMQPSIQDRENAIPIHTLQGNVVFDDVYFEYEPGQMVLCGINLEVHAGQMIAVVGPTGAGKTTLVGLVPRFYDTTKGSVIIDGINVKDIKHQSLRSHIGVVNQEPFLFSGTILDNIRYGKLNATDEEVKEAARSANAHDFIIKLPEGYLTDVGERGKLLSQGQRQLISIARALLSDPKILILDEATASIDTRTEALVQKALKRLLQGRTSFVVAHRLSTVRKADLVVVIKDGEMVEKGTHAELLAMNGVYADLYHRQLLMPEGMKNLKEPTMT